MEECRDTVEMGRRRCEPQGPQFLDPEQAEALTEQARYSDDESEGSGIKPSWTIQLSWSKTFQ